MGTTRNPLAGRYFNDPNIAVGLSNLAAAFAPPSPEEYLLAEQVKGERLTNQAMNDLYAAADGNMDVLGGIVAGGWTPNQGFEAMRGALSNERRGQDITAQTAITNNRTDNMFDLAQNYQQPLTFGEAIPALPPEYAAAIGAPALPATSGMASGAPKPAPTLAEAQGALFTQGAGMLTDDQIAAYAFGDTPVQNIVTADGPRVATTLGAIGQEPYINQGGQAAATPITYQAADGTRLGGFILPTGSFVASDGKTPLTPQEAGTAAEVGKPVGTNDELGITGSLATDEGRLRGTITTSNLLIDDLQSMIQANAGASGLAGTVQMIGQDLGQVIKELSTAFGENEVIASAEALAEIADPGPGYDPVYRQIRSGVLQMAYLNAQRDNPRGEVSRFALERQLEALGASGMFASDESLLAALQMNRAANNRAWEGAKAMAGKRDVYLGPGTGAPPPAAPAPGAGAGGGGSTVMEFDAEGNLIR